ncbi:MAG: 2-hydroxychromene-2-carboxylate isomerase [Alphaproteobacteria bacterium]
MSKSVEYYFSVISPFSYLAGLRLEAAASRHGATIVYKPVDIMTVFRETGGTPVPQRHPVRQAYRLVELRRVAAHHGLPINVKPAHFPTDQRPASRAILAARDFDGDVGRLAHAFLRAVWAEDRDIATEDTVASVLTASGYDAARVMAASAAQDDTFDAFTREAVERGVFGMPSYVYGGEIYWGQDSLDYLDAALSR